MGEKNKGWRFGRRRLGWMNQRGFTLVELMAVLALLALLLAIAVPAIGSIIEKSKASADESSIALMEEAGENAYVDDRIDFDGPEPESYTIPTLIEEGYLKLDEDDKFNQPENYVTKKNIGGEFIWMGDGEAGEPGGTDFGLVEDVEPIATCEDAIAEGYDVCIETAEELQAVQSESSLRYIVMNDIDLAGVDWTPIGGWSSPFTSELNGNGYRISHLTDSLFVFSVGLVQNLLLEDAAIVSDHERTGVLAGAVMDEAVVKNVCASGTVESSRNYTGGLIGDSHGVVEQSCADVAVTSTSSYTGGLIGSGGVMSGRNNYASGNVQGSSYTGGFIGNNQYEIQDAYATGDVTSTNSYVGGFAGDNNSDILGEVYATGTVTASMANVGGLVGRNNTSIQNSWSTGRVEAGGVNVGGLVGANYGPLADSYATGAVDGGGTTGGLVGDLSSDATNVYATGDVSADGNLVGGLVGLNNSTISGTSYAEGDVTASADRVGGFAGQNNGQMDGAAASGDVSGVNDVGGIVGFSYSGLSQAAYTGTVTAEGDRVGGLVGQMFGYIFDSYAVATVTSTGNTIGGLAGSTLSPIYTSFASGQVSGGTNAGAVYGAYDGWDTMEVVDSYWNTDFGGSSDLGTGKTTEELKQAATFSGFDFEDTWSIENGNAFPVLK